MNETIINGVKYYLIPETTTVDPLLPQVLLGLFLFSCVLGFGIGYFSGKNMPKITDLPQKSTHRSDNL